MKKDPEDYGPCDATDDPWMSREELDRHDLIDRAVKLAPMVANYLGPLPGTSPTNSDYETWEQNIVLNSVQIARQITEECLKED